MIKNLVKEIVNYRGFLKIPPKEREIIFYAEHAGYYPCFEGLIDELITRHNKKLTYITSDKKDPILNTQKAGVNAIYLNKLLPFLMAFINCKVFIMTLTELNQLHLKRSINPVHYVYVFHALVSTHMMYKQGAFDYYDSILCCGPHHNKEIRKYEELNSLMPKKLVNAGYYRLERIYNAYKKRNIQKSASDKKKTILIAPSWGDKNVLESCGAPLVQVLLDAGYEVIVRPHPETIRRSPDLISSLREKCGQAPGFVLETSVATDDSLLRSDVLICDCSGVALEYAFGTERPVLFMGVPVKIKNDKYKNLEIEPLEITLRSKIGKIVAPSDLSKVPELISGLMADQAKYKVRIAELRDRSVYSFGNSSAIGANHIISLVAGARV